MAKNILTIGISLADDAIVSEDFESKVSLLDWDIVLFKPVIEQFYRGTPFKYMGKPSLDDTRSFRLKESCEHWRREIKQAVDS